MSAGQAPGENLRPPRPARRGEERVEERVEGRVEGRVEVLVEVLEGEEEVVGL